MRQRLNAVGLKSRLWFLVAGALALLPMTTRHLQAAEPLKANAPSRLISDANGPNAAALCLAVDVDHALTGPITVPAATPTGQPHVALGPFYPVVVAPCDGLGQTPAAVWRATNRQEIRVQVKGQPMCLSARLTTGFLPLIDPFLAAFKAAQSGSPFAYLASDLKPAGVPNAKRVDYNPDLVVGACGQADAMDAWTYDDPTGSISSPGGWGRHRQCVTIHTDRHTSGTEIPNNTPVLASNCPDSRNSTEQTIATLDRASIPVPQRWHLETGKELLPTYPPHDPKDYFSGSHGVPITGPLGRCLTAEPNGKSVVTSDCDGRSEQDWKYEVNQIKLEAKNACLTADTNGTTTLTPCSPARNQLWAYTVKDSVASPAWLKADLFAQMRPVDDPAKCLAVLNDPFADTTRQRNPVHLLDCSTVQTRQMSWFIAARVFTMRVALVRFGHEPGHIPMPQTSDDDLKAIFAQQIIRLNDQYRRLAVRFVFDPLHDFYRIDDPAAANPANGQAMTDALAKLAATDLYGKITVALTEKTTPGGTTAWNVEYEPGRIVEPVTGSRFNFAQWSAQPGHYYDRAGLPAISNFIDFGGGLSLDLAASLRQSQQFGHYFGLVNTFQPDEFGDTPEDVNTPKAWIEAGSPPCGNLKTLAVNGKPVTPDRTNAEGNWQCEIGRSLGALTPMQLAKARWVLRSQLNRIQLTACEPTRDYSADAVACEDADSLALCKETSTFLSKTLGAAPMACRLGGTNQRLIGNAMKWVALQLIFKQTPEGQAIVNALAGKGRTAAPVADQTYADVSAALAAGKNQALTQALLNRIAEIRDMAARDHLVGLTENGFAETPPKPLTPAETNALKGYATKVLMPDFVANIPVIVN